MAKKKNQPKPKPRHVWGINPVERVKQNDKAYFRNREKRTIKQRIKEDLNEH